MRDTTEQRRLETRVNELQFLVASLERDYARVQSDAKHSYLLKYGYGIFKIQSPVIQGA